MGLNCFVTTEVVLFISNRAGGTAAMAIAGESLAGRHGVRGLPPLSVVVVQSEREWAKTQWSLARLWRKIYALRQAGPYPPRNQSGGKPPHSMTNDVAALDAPLVESARLGLGVQFFCVVA